MAFSLRCGLFGHAYDTDARTEQDTPYWVCKRCGSKRYTPPKNAPGGFHPGQGYGAGGTDFGGGRG